MDVIKWVIPGAAAVAYRIPSYIEVAMKVAGKCWQGNDNHETIDPYSMKCNIFCWIWCSQRWLLKYNVYSKILGKQYTILCTKVQFSYPLPMKMVEMNILWIW